MKKEHQEIPKHEGNNSTRRLVLYAILMGLTTALTALFPIPMLVRTGYLNLGDGVLIFTGLLFGPAAGFVVGGFGSALADMILGFPVYIPITLVVKGLEGLLAGLGMRTSLKKRPLILAILSGIFMAIGYFIAEIPLYGFPGSIANLPGNLLQGVVGGFVATLLYHAVGPIARKMNFLD